jgi:hypothetical protein
MRADTTRQPNLGDVMILVVACAVAMGIMKQADPMKLLAALNKSPTGSVSVTTEVAIDFWVEKWVSPILVTLAVAFLVIRLRRPRPPLRHLWQRPGTIALALIMVTLTLEGLLALASYLSYATGVVARPGSYINLAVRFSGMLKDATAYGGALILGTWISLAFSRRFRFEPGWIERASILIGSCWIATFLICWACHHLFGYLL